MPFPKHLLTDDEDLVLDLRPHWWFLAPAGAVLLIASVLGLGALVQSWWPPVEWMVLVVWLVAVGYFGVQYLLWTTTNFVVTNERVISRHGVVAKEGIEIPLDRINTVFFNQSIFERIIGAGDLGIESAGEGGRQQFSDIRKPNMVQNEIYRQVEAQRGRATGYSNLAHPAPPVTPPPAPEAAAPPPPASPSRAPAADTGSSIARKIEELDELRRKGLVTPEEFEAKRRELLDRM